MSDPSDREPPEHFADEPLLCTNCGREVTGDNSLCDHCACPSCGMLNPNKRMCSQPCQ